jgi:COP9 signalosome complex subunit 2
VSYNEYRALQQLNVAIEEVEELLINLILEGKVDGRIDQVGMRLELDKKCVEHLSSRRRLTAHTPTIRQSLEKKRYAALEKWTHAVEAVHGAVIAKTASGRQDLGPQEGIGGPMREPEW